MIHRISYAVSAGLQAELEAHQLCIDDGALGRFLEKYPSREDLVAGFLAEPAGQQYADAIRSLPAGQRILDIGVGFGNSSLFLAAQGYAVASDYLRALTRPGSMYRLCSGRRRGPAR